SRGLATPRVARPGLACARATSVSTKSVAGTQQSHVTVPARLQANPPRTRSTVRVSPAVALPLATLALCCLFSAAPAPAAPATVPRPRAHAAPGDTAHLAPLDKARLLHRWAEDAMVEADVESRQRAVRDLEEAIRLDPSNEDHWLTLGKVYLVGEMNTKARGCFDRAVRIDPQNPQSYTERGRAWKRDWVRWLDTLSLSRAITDFDTVTRLRPNGSEGWLALVPLLYDRRDLAGAARAAERALAGRPRVVDAGLAVAYTAYRVGDVERADSVF